MVSPDLTRSTGAWALSNQPHCVVSSVAGSRCTLPLVPVTVSAVCACACLRHRGKAGAGKQHGR